MQSLVTVAPAMIGTNLVIANRQRTKKINVRLLRQIVDELLRELDLGGAELGLRLVGASEMARINRRFLGHEGSTDVITFDYLAADCPRRPPEWPLHGELFVCVDDAVAQARAFQTTWQSEVVRYVVHGVLHLLGHDDLQPVLRRKMKRAENRLVRRLEARFSLAQLSRTVRIKS